ncbi:MAG: hypothetical protein GX769_01110 [Erysipelothrix sp.]|nr:hypothetical protein [Erysipelothrix sp.]
MDWNQEFWPHILERGFNYYKQGLVSNLKLNNDFVNARVFGSKDYIVYIEVFENSVSLMECSCPHADSGENCKHMAAVLFKYQEEVNKKIYSHSSEVIKESANKQIQIRQREINQLLDIVDTKALKEFLSKNFETNDSLFKQFKDLFVCEIISYDISKLKKEIDKIIGDIRPNTYSRYNYGYSYEFGDEENDDNYSFFMVNDFMSSTIQEMIDKGQHNKAFELVNYLYLEISNQDIDSSFGELDAFFADCKVIWTDILAKSTDDFKESMFIWFKSQIESDLPDYFIEEIENFLFENYLEKAYLNEKLVLADRKLKSLKNFSNRNYVNYQAEVWFLRYIKILEALNFDKEEIIAYARKNRKLNAVRSYYINICIENQDFKTAIEMLIEGKNVNREFIGIVKEYSLLLKDLYKELGDKEAYVKELYSLVTRYNPGDIETYKELKLMYPKAKWRDKRETIFRQLSDSNTIEDLYLLEKLYDRLLDVVVNYPHLSKLFKYEKHLKHLYPQELLAKYVSVVENMAKNTQNRSYYREIVTVLRRMQNYPGGQEMVLDIVQEWQIKYKKRRAMMEELRRL